METSKKDTRDEKVQKFFLRWSAGYNAAYREEIVDFIRSSHSRWTFRCNVLILERTPVYLTGDFYMGNGIIQSCCQEGLSFILNITMTDESTYLPPRQQFDPGLLSVDNFLTEEEEAKILDSLGDNFDAPCSTVMRELLAPAQLIHRSAQRVDLWCRQALLQFLTAL